jgi:hypothetical protein
MLSKLGIRRRFAQNLLDIVYDLFYFCITKSLSISFAKSLVAKRRKQGMLYPAVARWNSKCFGEIERRRRIENGYLWGIVKLVPDYLI